MKSPGESCSDATEHLKGLLKMFRTPKNFCYENLIKKFLKGLLKMFRTPKNYSKKFIFKNIYLYFQFLMQL